MLELSFHNFSALRIAFPSSIRHATFLLCTHRHPKGLHQTLSEGWVAFAVQLEACP